MKLSRVVFLAISLILCASLSFAEDAPSGTSSLAFNPNVRIWGADLGIGITGLNLIPGLGTELWLNVGGGYETYNYWRDGAGIMIQSPSESQLSAGPYANTNFEWSLGIEQGILANSAGGDLIKAFFYYQGRIDSRSQTSTATALVLNSGLLDANGGFFNSFLFGAHIDTRASDKVSGTKSGYWGELSGEWGPSALSNVGTDYLRFNASVRAFAPLFKFAEGEMNILSAYVGNFFSADFSMGQSVPLFVRQSFGGTMPRIGIGEAVRGVDTGRYDAKLKMVDNLEIRLNGPSIGLVNIYPILVAFADLGYFNQVGEATIASPLQLWLFSIGAELRLNILDFAAPGIGIAYCFNDTAGGSNFSWYIAFGLKF